MNPGSRNAYRINTVKRKISLATNNLKKKIFWLCREVRKKHFSKEGGLGRKVFGCRWKKGRVFAVIDSEGQGPKLKEIK